MVVSAVAEARSAWGWVKQGKVGEDSGAEAEIKGSKPSPTEGSCSRQRTSMDPGSEAWGTVREAGMRWNDRKPHMELEGVRIYLMDDMDATQ